MYSYQVETCQGTHTVQCNKHHEDASFYNAVYDAVKEKISNFSFNNLPTRGKLRVVKITCLVTQRIVYNLSKIKH